MQLDSGIRICFTSGGELKGLAIQKPASREYEFWGFGFLNREVRFCVQPWPLEILSTFVLPHAPSTRWVLTMFANMAMGNFLYIQKYAFLLTTPGISYSAGVQWLILCFLFDLGFCCEEFGIADICRRLSSMRENASEVLRDGGDFKRVSAQPFAEVPTQHCFVPDAESTLDANSRCWFSRLTFQNVEGVVNLLEKHPDAFDVDDLASVRNEMNLAIRGDLLSSPIQVKNSVYSSADYWVVLTGDGVGQSEVVGVCGLITFFAVTEEAWIGYLCEFGAPQVDLLRRRAEECGFKKLRVWTTVGNKRATDKYEKYGFNKDRLPSAPAVLCSEDFVSFTKEL
jgi:hypothetical protein